MGAFFSCQSSQAIMYRRFSLSRIPHLITLAFLAALMHAQGAGPAASPQGVIHRLDPALDNLIAPHASLKVVHSGASGFFEGPSWVPGAPGYFIFSDIPGDTLYRVGPGGKVAELVQEVQPRSAPVTAPDGMIGPNGTTISPSGLIAYCVFGGGRIEELNRHGQRKVVVSALQDGHALTLPNDLVYRSDGLLYFTQEGGAYLVRPEQNPVRLDGTKNPNGIAFSPGEKYLYLTEHPDKIVRFEVEANGWIRDPRLFVDMSLDDPAGRLKDPSPRSGGFVDGVKVDKDGNVWAVGPGGVWILTPDGRHIGTILTPVARFTNLAFGGDDGRTLFLTAPEGVYSLQLASSRVRPRITSERRK